MRYSCYNVLSASPEIILSQSAAVSTDHVFRVSAQLVASGALAGGSFILQGSNDPTFSPSQPSLWSNIGNAVAVSGNGAYMALTSKISYQWVRAAYTPSTGGQQSITTIADVTTTVDQAETFSFDLTDGPITSGYFVAVVGDQSFNVDYTETADDFQAQVNAVPGYEAVTISGDFNSAFFIDFNSPNPGVDFLDISDNFLENDFQENVGINFSFQFGEFNSSLNNTYFFIHDANDVDNYYVWFNVSGQGIDPMVPGYTGLEVDISANDTDSAVATALSAALDALPGFSSSIPGAANVVVVKNVGLGIFTPASDSTDFPTGFTFQVLDTGVVSINIKTLGN